MKNASERRPDPAPGGPFLIACIDYPAAGKPLDTVRYVSGWIACRKPIERIFVRLPSGEILGAVERTDRTDVDQNLEAQFPGAFEVTEPKGFCLDFGRPRRLSEDGLTILLSLASGEAEGGERWFEVRLRLRGEVTSLAEIGASLRTETVAELLSRVADAGPRKASLKSESNQRPPRTSFAGGRDPREVFDRYVGEMANPRILEIGAREVITGSPRERFGAGASYVGLDIIDGPGVDVVGDAHELSKRFGTEAFDAVFSQFTFEHLAMPWVVALEINKVLRTGGVACVVAPHTFPVHEMPWDFWRYGLDSFATIFCPATGFEILAQGGSRSGGLCEHHSEISLPQGQEAYLFTSVVARKTRDCDPRRFSWSLTPKDLLGKEHFYPSADGEGVDSLKYEGALESELEVFGQDLRESGCENLILITDGSHQGSLGDLEPEVTSEIAVSSEEEMRGLRNPGEVDHGELADALIVWNALRFLSTPWLFPLDAAPMLKPGGKILVVDSHSRPVTARPDYWRFGSESFRSLFHPGTGFRLDAAVLCDPCTFYPDSPGTLFFDYDWTCPCYQTAVCRATRLEGEVNPELRWGIEAS